MPKPILTWNIARTVWETNQTSLDCEHWEPFLGTWQTSGMTLNGQLYELVQSERHTEENEFSLLRSPMAGETSGGIVGEAVAISKGHQVRLGDQIKDLFPTPTVGHVRNHDEPVENYQQRRQDFTDGKTKGMPGASLGVAVRMNLLMTPVASEGAKAPAQQSSEVKSKTGQVWLSNQAKDMELTWGRFEPAIRQWEQITRPAPSPVKADGRDGNNRLSAEFAEWMMGLPQGWVTDVPIKRNSHLKALGNGVVPQQAEAALRILLEEYNG